MSDNKSLDALFKSGTKEQFIERYNAMKTTPAQEDDSSVFKEDLDKSIGELFDTVDKNHDNFIDDSEIAEIKKYNNDNDNDSTITENDVEQLYNRTMDRIKSRFSSNNPEDIYNQASQTSPDTQQKFGGDNALQNISAQIDAIRELMTAKQNASESKIQRYENQLDNLIVMYSDLSAREKQQYSQNTANIKDKRSELKKQEQELEATQLEMTILQAEINYKKQHKDVNDPKVKEEIEEFTNKYNVLSRECDSISASITQQNAALERLLTTRDNLIKKAKLSTTEFQQKKQDLMTDIGNERTTLDAERAEYDSQITALEAAQQLAVTRAQETYPSEYYDEDTSNFSYDSAELQNKWQAKWTRELGASKAQAKIDSLGGAAFFNKVCAVAQRLNCDANALMGVMNSESGVTADIGNAAGGTAVGLIQFMPSTCQELFRQEGLQLSAKDASAKMRSMSALEQLNYVEKMINYSKKVGGLKADDKVDCGTLYTLVFLPAYAKRDVLTVKGHKFYNANSGLDRDGDGQITKADMARRVREKMA